MRYSEAYKVFREIMESYGGGDAKWNEALLDSARGSQVRNFCYGNVNNRLT